MEIVAIVLRSPPFWAAISIIALVMIIIARLTHLRWLPAFFIRLLLLSGLLLAGWLIWQDKEPASRTQAAMPIREILLVDLSHSLPSSAQEQIKLQAEAWATAVPNRLIVTFADTAIVVENPSEGWPTLNGDTTNVAAALAKGITLLGEAPGHLILLSDGEDTDETAIEDVLATLQPGQYLDVLPVLAPFTPDDVYVGQIQSPGIVWQKAPFQLALPVYSQQQIAVEITLQVNGEIIASREETLAIGENQISFTHTVTETGVVLLEAVVSVPNDPRPENNVAAATAQALPPSPVLFVTEKPHDEPNIVRALMTNGFEIDVVTPAELPTDLTLLQTYGVILLDSFPAQQLTAEQMLTLDIFVARLGGGLIMLGGGSSYTLGEYDDTLLEPMLPVILEPPPRMQRPPLTFVIVFDQSQSMKVSASQEVVPLDLAKEAAVRAMEILYPGDYIGVMTYSDDPLWRVPLSPLKDGLVLRTAQDSVVQATAFGITNMYAALSETVESLLAEHTTDTRQILLLSDGKSSDGSFEEFQALAQLAASTEIVISTIALGEEGDLELMEMIAAETGGRFHFVADSTQLPRIMVAEGQAARANKVQEGETKPIPGLPAHPALTGFSAQSFPEISAYNALTSRAGEGATDILVSASFGDPVLSGWQYGLGRVLVWTSDSGMVWSEAWSDWPDLGLFWSQLVQYAIVAPSLPADQVDISSTYKDLSVELSLIDDQTRPANWVTPQFTYALQTSETVSQALQQQQAGRYSGTLPAPAPGAYRAVISFPASPADDTEKIVISTPFVVPYPVEWRPTNPELGEARMKLWASIANGETITSASLNTIEVTTAALAESGPTPRDQVIWYLLMGSLLFWPLEIALRRRWLPWQ